MKCDKLYTYDIEPVYDGLVNFDYNEKTDVLLVLVKDTNLDEFVNNIYDWD